MRVGLMAACIAALSLGASLAFAQSKSKPLEPPETKEQNECTLTAAVDYNKRSLALMQEDKGSPPSVDASIAIRRLEEEFCRKFIRCVVDDENSLRFRTAFYSCLKDEALEKYDAVPRDEVPDKD